MAIGKTLWPPEAALGWELSRSFPRSRRGLLIGALAAVTLTALAVRLPLLGTAYSAPDTSQYLKVAHGIFHGGFSENLRPPAYSFLLALMELVGADPVKGMVLLQNLVGIVLPGLVLLAGWRFFGPAVGIVAGFLTAASPLMQITEQMALADYLFGTILFLATALLAEAALRVRAKQEPRALLIATGLAFGLAALFRANGLLAFLAMPLVLLVAAKGLKPGLRSAAVAVAAAALIAPWCLHNLIRFGDPNLATEGGISLYARAVTWDAVPPPDHTPEGKLARKIYNTAEPGSPGHPASGEPTTALFNALVQDGMSPAEASSKMGGLARTVVFEHPWVYLENTVDILRRYRDLYDPRTFWTNPNADQIAATRHYFQFANLPDNTQLTEAALAHRELPGDSALTRGPWQLAQALTAALYAITVGGVLSLLLLLLGRARRRLAAFAFLLVLLMSFAGGSLTAVFSQRYDVMLAPFVWMLLAATGVLIVELGVEFFSSGPIVALPRSRPARSLAGGIGSLSRSAAAATRSFGSAVGASTRRLARVWLPNLRSRAAEAWTPFRLSRIALPATAFLAPFSATHLMGSLTLGRAVAVTLAIALALDFARVRPRRLPIDRPTALAGCAYLGLFLWIAISVGAWGCNCEGKFGGFAEFAFVGLLALATIACGGPLRERLMLALLAGLGFAAVLALLGVGAINSGTVDLTQTGGRLSGTFGNANELGFAMALGVPIAAAYALDASGRRRYLFAASLAVLALALALTYSRGGIIAAAGGLLAIGLWKAGGSRRQTAMILAGAAAAALLASALYSAFQHERESVSFESVPRALRPLDRRDLSGWDTRAGSSIPAGPAHLRNRPGGFVVHATPGQGASYVWGEAAAGSTYRLRFRARTIGGRQLPLSFSLDDAIRGGGREGRVTLGPRPRTLGLSWRPQRRAPHAQLSVWQRGDEAAAFLLSDVSVRVQAPGRAAHVIEVPDKLRGSLYTHMVAASEKAEERYVRSRLDASKLALEAFGSSPLRGIGWGTFPEYSDEHLDYGQLAAHDEYLSFAAELGLVGLLLLGLLAAAIISGIRRAGRTTAETAAVGAIAAAAVGLVFVEALPVPQLSVPVAMIIAVLCARRAAPS